MKLFPHQEVAVQYLMKRHYCILGDEMGLGKTVTMLELANRVGGNVLVICPAFLKLTWKTEADRWYKGDKKKLEVISYSMLKDGKKYFEWANLILADEFHYMKNLKAKRTQYFHQYMEAHPPDRFVGATGTAIKNRVEEFYSLLGTIDYNPHNTSGQRVSDRWSNYWQFAAYFSHKVTTYIHGRKITSFEGLRNRDDLKLLLRGKYIRRKASKVLDLPPLIRKTIILKGGQDKYLREVWEAMKRGEGIKHYSTQKRKSSEAKVAITVEYVKDLQAQTRRPIVVFTDHVETARLLGQMFEAKARYVTGKTPIHKRDEVVKEFQLGKIPVLVATVGCLSVGVTLTRSNNVVYNDIPWVPGDLEQSIKRIHRIGSTEKCVAHFLAWGPIDARIIKTLNDKVKVIKAVL